MTEQLKQAAQAALNACERIVDQEDSPVQFGIDFRALGSSLRRALTTSQPAPTAQELERAAEMCDGFAAPDMAAALRGQPAQAGEVQVCPLQGCRARILPTQPAAQQAAGEPVAMWVDLKDGEIVQLGDRLFSGGKTWRTVDQESQLAGREYHAKHWWPMQRAATSPAPGVPDGFVLVQSPITEAMHQAACKVLTRAPGLDGLPQRMLDALAAAQAKGGEHA